MAESTIVKTKRDGTITFRDGTTPTAEEYTIAFEAGDLNIAIAGRTVNLFLDRGVMTDPPSIRFGDDQPMSGTFTAQLRDLNDAAVATLTDFLTNTGFFATDWVSRGGPNAEVKTVQIIWTIAGLDHGDPADHTISADHCYLTGSIADGDPVTLSVAFTSFDLFPLVA